LIKDILTELDRIAARALVEGAQPISRAFAYESGRRIGVCQGIARAREAIVNFHSKDSDKDDTL
jgi:hypothetical protein